MSNQEFFSRYISVPLLSQKSCGKTLLKIKSIYVKESPVKQANKEDEDITISLVEKVRKGDKIYLLTDRKNL